jgi:hypothetical protein
VLSIFVHVGESQPQSATLNIPLISPSGEGIYGSGNYETEQRQGNLRLDEHGVLRTVGQRHDVGWAECGRIRETQGGDNQETPASSHVARVQGSCAG